jgi:hypothetical protein
MTFLCAKLVLSHSGVAAAVFSAGGPAERANWWGRGGAAAPKVDLPKQGRSLLPSGQTPYVAADDTPKSASRRRDTLRPPAARAARNKLRERIIAMAAIHVLRIFGVGFICAHSSIGFLQFEDVDIYGQVANCALNPRKVGLRSGGLCVWCHGAWPRMQPAKHRTLLRFLFDASSVRCCISLPPTACTAQILDIIFALDRREIGLSLKVNESSAQGPNMNWIFDEVVLFRT